MILPTIEGLIDRRMLVNFTADPEIIQSILPEPFRPRTFNEKAIVGICLIRLKQIRPKGLPSFMGLSSENGAHRIAVQWEENNELKEGVYIPRRDTSSLFNVMAGGRVFPGKHFRAVFDVREKDGEYHIAFESSDGTSIKVDAELSDHLQPDSIFSNLETASNFFENGSVGFSPNGNKHEGIRLKTYNWRVQPLKVHTVSTSYFENEKLFPKGSVKFDNALLMTHAVHRWEGIQSIKKDK